MISIGPHSNSQGRRAAPGNVAMEVSFKTEVASLRLGEGEVFRGEGIVAVTKALLQAGVGYIGGYQGAPVSHLLDIMVQSRELLDELGVHLSTPVNEASAAAMLGASINYPVRGAVTWKSVVGTNVASDALSNLASAGVTGGALIVLGEDYGEGASVIQERTYAFALKSSIWLLDPRPQLPSIVTAVEQAFELSEASHTPVMLQLRIRACHVFGEFRAKNNRRPRHSMHAPMEKPATFDYAALAHPPATFVQERAKVDARLPAARRFIVERGLNEVIAGRHGQVGIVLLGGLYNTVLQQLEALGYADAFGSSDIPLLVLNVAFPLVPEQLIDFCRDKRAVLVVEEGSPAFIEDSINVLLRKAQLTTCVFGKDVLAETGEYRPATLLQGLGRFLRAVNMTAQLGESILRDVAAARSMAVEILGSALPERPPTFCTGCPERPFFTAMKLFQRQTGPVHVSADIGCHALATFPPFSSGNTILGYGMSLAAAQAVGSSQKHRTVSVMGDGGFWHNGLTSGVISGVFNNDDSVLVILDNGYSSATGIQSLPSSAARQPHSPRLSIEQVLRSCGVRWIRRVSSYDVRGMFAILRKAMGTPQRGPKVIIAEGECQLAKQRRLQQQARALLADGQRVVRTRFGVDEDVCTGDQSCIRLSGCPSLTIKPSTDPLRTAPVAHVNNGCVGCGLCGEVAHAAQLCPSFYRLEVISNSRWWERLLGAARAGFIRLISERRARPQWAQA